jgi:hypothetical protein
MRISEGFVGRLADLTVSALLIQGYVHPKVPKSQLIERVSRLLLQNLQAEQALEDEAEELAARHSRNMVGMDQRKVMQGIKTRLAKERGFTL